MMYEPQKSEHNEDTNITNNQNEEQSSVVEGGIGSTFQTAVNNTTTDGSIRAPSPQQPPLINNYFQSQPNTANSANNMGIKVDNSNRGINVDNIFASITDEVATSTITGNINNNNVANINSNNIFQNFATHNNNMQPSAANSNIPFRKYSDSNANYNKGNMIPASNNMIPASSCIAPNHTSSSSGKDTIQKATLDRNESDGTSDEIGEILMSKSYDARSFLRPGVHRNMSESESDPKPTIRHAGYLLKRSNFPYTASPYKNAVVSSNTNKSAAKSESTTNEFAPLPLISSTSSSNEERLSPYNQLPFGGLDDDTLGGGEGKEYITQATDSTAVISNITLRQLESEQSVDVKSSTVTETSTSVIDSEQDDSNKNDESCFCSPIVQYFKDIFNHKQQPQNKNALIINTDTSPQRRRSPTKQNRISPNKSISSPPKSPKPYNMPLKPPAKSDPMPISPAGGGERKVISAGTSKQQQQRRRSSYTNVNDNGDNNIGIASTLSTIASSSTQTKDEQKKKKKKKIYPPPPPDYIDPKDGHIWRSKYCILEEGILYFYRTAEEGESDEAFTERYESRAYSEELQDIVLGEELVFHSSISPERRSMSKEDRVLNRAVHDRNMMGSTDFLSKSPMQ